MRLYYMTKLDTLEKYILPEQEIRISTFDKVNDPFELLGAIQGGKVGHRDFAWLRDHWTKTVGFISFSDNWKSPLMWAHYASNHTGVCLGIEVTDKRPLKMEYQPSRVALQFDLKNFENAADAALMEKLVITKFQEWEYEHEWRILFPLEYDLKYPRPEYFYERFTPEFELREIILGARCERSLEEIQKQIFGVTASVQVKRARPAFGSFSMVQQKLQHPITVTPHSDFTRAELRLAAAERYARARQADRERRGKEKR
jgi:hypothetical protein